MDAKEYILTVDYALSALYPAVPRTWQAVHPDNSAYSFRQYRYILMFFFLRWQAVLDITAYSSTLIESCWEITMLKEGTTISLIYYETEVTQNSKT
jgi:hypothetical protein